MVTGALDDVGVAVAVDVDTDVDLEAVALVGFDDATGVEAVMEGGGVEATGLEDATGGGHGFVALGVGGFFLKKENKFPCFKLLGGVLPLLDDMLSEAQLLRETRNCKVGNPSSKKEPFPTIFVVSVPRLSHYTILKCTYLYAFVLGNATLPATAESGRFHFAPWMQLGKAGDDHC